MPDPHDSLAIFAEVSIAIVGFSGIVIALGQRSVGSLSALERRRLWNLFTLAGLALGLSLGGIALLHIDGLSHIWRWGSAVVFLFGAPWLIRDAVRVLRLEAAEKVQINPILISTFNALAAVVLILQLVNVIALNAAWLFFLALLLIVAGALQQFILLVMSGVRGRPPGTPVE